MKTRMIHTKIWEDEFFVKLGKNARYLFLYLLTNSRINLIGCYHCPDRVITFETGLNSNELEKAKESLYPKAVFINGWVYLPNAGRLNPFKGPKNRTAAEKEWKQIPENVVAALNEHRVSIEYTYPIDTTSNHNHNHIVFNNKGVEKKQSLLETTREYLAEFNRIFDSNYSSTKVLPHYLEFWLEEYTPDQIKQALAIAKTHHFYKDKLTPIMLLRKSEDRIGQMLNYNTKKRPTITLKGGAKQ